MTLGHLREINHDGVLYLEPDMMTWQIERLFETEFGLHVQVLRKSGNQWLVTSTTDDLTLDDQNTRGQAFETSTVEPEDAIDYRERD